ncbi:MAG: hypothetical protein ICV83_30085, partial [Cytophagales bacterium]|nr:hypothetical protein [Cytophagales bacterium]
MRNPYAPLLALLLCLIPGAGFAQSDGDPFAAAQAAWDRRDYPVFLGHMGRLVSHVGRQPALLLDLARGHALAGDTAAALTVLH